MYIPIKTRKEYSTHCDVETLEQIKLRESPTSSHIHNWYLATKIMVSMSSKR